MIFGNGNAAPKWTLAGIDVDKDRFFFHHREDETALLKQNYESRKDPNNGYSKTKEFQKIASFSMLGWMRVIQKYPEVTQGDSDQRQKAIYKALRDPEFDLYRTSGKL